MAGPHGADRAHEILAACRDGWVRRTALVELLDTDPSTVAGWCRRFVSHGMLLERRARGSTRAIEHTLAPKWRGQA